MKIAECDIIFIADEEKNGKSHWMSRWADRFPNSFSMNAGLTQKSNERLEVLFEIMKETTRPVIFVAQGEGILLLSQALSGLTSFPVRGAFLVSPVMPDRNIPDSRECQREYHQQGFPFKAILVASQTDESYSAEYAKNLGKLWNIPVLDAGEAGGLDEKSGHGPWPEGLMSFAKFLQTV